MQVSRINQVATVNKTNKQQNINKNNNKSAESFKGIGGVVDKVSLITADAIENGGLFVSFTLQDMLGTNLPRPLMGLKRNAKENKGEANKSFAAKELVREMLTGPSMFIIPAGILAAGNKVFGKATEVPMKFIKSLSEIHAANPVDAAGNAISKKDFYKNAFTEVLKNAKSETAASQATIEMADDFASRLSNGLKDKALKKETMNNLADDFVNVVKSHAKNPAYTDFTTAKIAKTTTAPFRETVSHIVSYADDVVEKAKSQNTAKLKPYIEKVANKKVLTRLGANAVMYAAVITFLQIIPKLYNKAEGEKNAGLKGLMKEETLNSTTAVAPQEKKDKSNPSFGSAASVAKKLTGDGLVGKIAKGCEFEGINLSFPLLLGVMGLGILLPRTRQAKDKYDKEEILRRDLVTCATMCFAEKELRKGFSKLNEVKSGMVLAAKEEGFKNKSLPKRLFDYLRPIKGIQIFSTEQIISKYSGLEKYKDGISGFCDFIEKQGGNLKKVFSITDESKEIVSNLLQKEGKTLETANNSVIKDVISKAKDSEEVKKLTGLFKEKNNPWVQKAKTINARFTAFSVLVLVPVFLGFMLPWINEKATKKRINKENALNNNANTKAIDMTYLLKNDKTSKVFEDMNKMVK